MKRCRLPTLRRPFTLALASVTLIGLASIGPAMAQQRDAEQPIEVEADRLDLDDRAGTAVYTGDVDIRQGSMRLTGDRVEFQRNAAGELSRATARGERAYIEQQPDPEQPVVRGWGRTIVYHVAERRVELIDRAELHQGGDTFDGGYLEYFLDRRVVQARSQSEGVEGSQRIRMTLQPER
ncbi:lipopolysaccharide transport periplasmic protein LptA [Halomonas sp. MCCC 1A17488]|uniref:Lipopolysaccharide export system protein LptA n=1 Tax=Billgrantia sulfidoxydans TaxID=2733484 RepID=A0ABX7W9A6_9GAMM|nr:MULTISPECIES: lipopolysaccharide transport periplasmic protein LptA [Halomonas]MCE8014611.1 lipopolysaccharide transport periplasmic protein LptA [Halomonas sp. MCCC 1A17488]MCG3237944.1 lipopolysaccharide transport periplasmic protein LptA [Halomonas sp. MCCC 1A17488]QPP48272.1 lipopolysaccharide transport periplasmic protein LptA [Halomonas sp. SS10-MC5]QTP55574.1 lipopolysaccharide transport periplasmic protein LptA [Halomonas sulfidoxydans]